MKIHNGEVIGTRTSDRSQASDLLLKLVRKNVPSASPHGHCPILLTVVLPNVPGQLRDAPVSCTDLCLPQGTEFIHLLFWLTFLAHFLSDLWFVETVSATERTPPFLGWVQSGRNVPRALESTWTWMEWERHTWESWWVSIRRITWLRTYYNPWCNAGTRQPGFFLDEEQTVAVVFTIMKHEVFNYFLNSFLLIVLQLKTISKTWQKIYRVSSH